MCLEKIDKVYNPTKRTKWTERFKVFEVDSTGKHSFPYFPVGGSKAPPCFTVQLDTQLKAKSVVIKDKGYRSGFHVFKDESDANKYVDQLVSVGHYHPTVTRVQVRNLIAEGKTELFMVHPHERLRSEVYSQMIVPS